MHGFFKIDFYVKYTMTYGEWGGGNFYITIFLFACPEVPLQYRFSFTNTFLWVFCVNTLYNIVKKASSSNFSLRFVLFEEFVAVKYQGIYSKSILFHCKI